MPNGFMCGEVRPASIDACAVTDGNCERYRASRAAWSAMTRSALLRERVNLTEPIFTSHTAPRRGLFARKDRPELQLSVATIPGQMAAMSRVGTRFWVVPTPG